MPNLNEIISEAATAGSGQDVVRRKYLRELNKRTGRNTIIYYSGWLQKPAIPFIQPHLGVNDSDKNGFMATIHQLDRSKGLDLILHTPGGDIAATESLVDYLRQMFGTDIRAIVPQLAMSAGTMMALACKEILMGKHSNLGPIDPQIGMFPAQAVIEEFTRAQQEIASAETAQVMQSKIAVWQPIIAKYSPTLIGQCQNAMKWSADITSAWLKTGMFAGEADADSKAAAIIEELSSHSNNKTHSRHIHRDRLVQLGLKISEIESDHDLQDTILSLHHACIHTLTHTPAIKMIENQNGIGFILSAQFQMAGAPAASGMPGALPQSVPEQI
jgi:ATP-dependent protease ClpP protease subunit